MNVANRQMILFAGTKFISNYEVTFPPCTEEFLMNT